MRKRVVISDGDRELNLVHEGGAGVFLQEFDEEFTTADITYAEPVDGEGRKPVRKRPQNVERSATLAISAYDAENFQALTDELQELTASIDKRGGTLIIDDGHAGAVTFDLVKCHLGEFSQANTDQFVIQGIALQYERLPYGRLEEVTIFEDEPLEGPIAAIEIEGVSGHVDAMPNLILSEESGEQRSFLEVGLTYDYDVDEQLEILADDFDLDGTGGSRETRSGSSSTQVVRSTVGQQATAVARSGRLTHVGRKRVSARLYAERDGVQARLIWRVGDAPWRHEPWRPVAGTYKFTELHLATIDIQRRAGSDHTWEAMVEARVATGYADVDVDTITPFGADQYGQASTLGPSGVAEVIVAGDDFMQTSGGYTGKQDALGNTISGEGDDGDFLVDSGLRWLKRTAHSDSADTGRHVYAGPNVRGFRLNLSMRGGDYGIASTGHRIGRTFRRVDSTNFGFAGIKDRKLVIYKVLGGTWTKIAEGERSWSLPIFSSLVPSRSLVVTGDGSGLIVASMYSGGSLSDVETISVVDPEFADGGDLEVGKCGIYDEHTDSASGDVRFYLAPNTYAVPEPSPVLFAGGAVHLLSDRALREETNGSGEDPSFGRVPVWRGRHLRIPPATRARRSTLLTVRARRFNISEGIEDLGRDDELSATLKVTPRVLLTGRP